MKEKLFYILISIGLPISCLAQTYDSLVKPGKKWYYTQIVGEQHIAYSGGNLSISRETRTYNGLIYYKIVDKTSVNKDSLWIREENKRVYILNLSDSVYHGQEILMYDFNLEKGDSFRFKTKFYYKDSFLNALLIVDDTYIINNRKNIKFKIGEFAGFGTFLMRDWVEGIGGRHILYYSFHMYNFVIQPDYAFYVSCLFDNEKQILPLAGNCDSTLSYPRIDNYQIKIYPNPTQRYFNVNLNNSKKHVVGIYDQVGQKIDELQLEGSTNYLINCNYTKGLYVLHISNAESIFQTKLIIQ